MFECTKQLLKLMNKKIFTILPYKFCLGLNEMCVWFLFAYLPLFFNPTLNIKMVFGEKIPKMGTFSDFVTIFFAKCYNKI